MVDMASSNINIVLNKFIRCLKGLLTVFLLHWKDSLIKVCKHSEYQVSSIEYQRNHHQRKAAKTWRKTKVQVIITSDNHCQVQPKPLLSWVDLALAVQLGQSQSWVCTPPPTPTYPPQFWTEKIISEAVAQISNFGYKNVKFACM
jgi:hypothetical protein